MDDISSKIYAKNTIKRVEHKLKLLGINDKSLVYKYLNMRVLTSILILIISLIYFKYGFIMGPILCITTYILFEKICLDYKIKKRGEKLEKEAILFMEVLVLTLEGGRNLENALRLTINNVDSEISHEFEITLKEVRLGKSLNESLENMKKRIPSEVINNTILNMIQASNYGTNIKEAIYNEIDFLRNKQILRVKGEIAKLPTKISVISVIFFIPIMLLIILGPLLIKFISS